MARLEDLTKGALARGVLADRSIKVVDAEWITTGYGKRPGQQRLTS
jgi:hypothetical protein